MKTLLPLALALSALAAPVVAAAAPVSTPSNLSAVTVYTDRAVVTRSATIDITPGPLEVVFERLPAALLSQSLQVAGHGTAQVTILDVTDRETYVDATPNERVKSLEDEFLALAKQRRALDDRTKALKAQDASLGRIENASTQSPTKEAPRLSLDDAGKLLAFLEEQRGKLIAEQQSIDGQIVLLAAKQTAVEKQLAELRGSGKRSYKSVVVRLDATSAGKFDLTVRYAVPNASWSPAFDARVLSTEHAVQLGYFGIVRQNTGEDWKNVELILSTARPSLGGSPPALSPWVLDVIRPMPDQTVMGPMSRMAAPRGGGADASAVTLEAFEVSDKKAQFAQARVDPQATSASFNISAPATVLSDNSPQRVPVTTLPLETAPEYLTTPKQVPAAFLTAKVTNTSDFPLLAGELNVFLDNTFVAVSALPTVMPGEKFDLALGADEGIAVKRKLNKRFTEDTGVVNKGKRITYDFTLTIQNNKKTAEKIVVTDQVPVSRNEKIVVKVLAPEEKEAKPDADGTVKWTLNLKPGEKRELTLKFTIEHPNDIPAVGLD